MWKIVKVDFLCVQQYITVQQKNLSTHDPRAHHVCTIVQQYSNTAEKKKEETETRDLTSRPACPESTAVPPRTNKKIPFSVFSRNFLS